MKLLAWMKLWWLKFWNPTKYQDVEAFPTPPQVDYVKKTEGRPGSKIARKVMKARGLPYHGEVYHTGELTELNRERQLDRRLRHFTEG